MVRQRLIKKDAEQSSAGSSASNRKHGVKRKGSSAFPWVKVIWIIFALAVLVGLIWFIQKKYLETRINTPFGAARALSKSGLEVPNRFWGSYRPGVYFGLKTRSPADLIAGLMWLLPNQVKQGNIGFRHWCEQGDNLDKYGWVAHDGEHFGVQEIFDRGLKLTTSFVKRSGGQNGGDWTARISVEPTSEKTSNEKISLFFYAGFDEGGTGVLNPQISNKNEYHMQEILGQTNGLGSFRMRFVDDQSNGQHFFSKIRTPGPHAFTNSVLEQLRMFENNVIGLERNVDEDFLANLVVYQVNAVGSVQLEIIFESSSVENNRAELFGEVYTKELNAKLDAFDERFEKTFGLKGKGYNSSDIEFAKAAVSNMIGGIGYFHGHSLVQSDLLSHPVKYWESSLYTAVPSRSFFPRGFLWDEGFHNLLISKWNGEISADILAHWMDLINVEGWIPREQILGLEARAKVPAEFVIQHNKNANPPTLILTLHSMCQEPNLRKSSWFKEFLQKIWTRLELWYDWFNTTQAGKLPGTFRWRGRNGTLTRELNPKTLTSGLDDFPRASHPTDDERHVDLRCWMALASKLLADIASIIGKNDAAAKYSSVAEFLHDNQLLSAIHWSEEHKAFLDFGLHTEHVKLERPKPTSTQMHTGQKPEKVRVVKSEPKMQFVNQIGYVSLFPLLLQILEPDSPHLKHLLADIEDPQKLFTPYGIRSLSKDATLYMKRNTEHDPPYWRGPIWINMNYLAVRALHHYSSVDGPYKSKARSVYEKLRKAIISNVVKEYHRTGYIWEQYNDITGHGQGCRPFTGWTSLVVLMMGEKY